MSWASRSNWLQNKNQHWKTKPKCSAILLRQRFTYTFSFYINFGVHQDRYKTPKRWQNCQRWSSKLRAVSILQESQYQGVEATGLQQMGLSWNELPQMDFILKDGRMIKVGWVGWVYVEMTTSDEKNRTFSHWVGENLGELCQEKGLESALLKLAAWEPKVKMNHHQLWREATVFMKTWRLFLATGCLVQSVVNINLWAPHPLWFDVLRWYQAQHVSESQLLQKKLEVLASCWPGQWRLHSWTWRVSSILWYATCNWVFFNEIPQCNASLCYSKVAKQSNHISGNHIVDVYLYRLLMDCPQNGAFIAGRLPFKTWRWSCLLLWWKDLSPVHAWWIGTLRGLVHCKTE